MPSLISALEDDAPPVRESVAAALGKMGPVARGAMDALAGRLSDDDADVRFMAAVALGRMGPGEEASRIVPRLAAALEDPSHRVRRRAAQTLGALPDIAGEAVPALVSLLSDAECRLEASWALGRMGEEAVRALVAPLSSTDPEVRMAATRALAGCATRAREAARPLLLEASGDDDERVRTIAAKALGEQPGAAEEVGDNS